MNRIPLALTLITLAQFASAASVTPADIVAGKLIPASTSPDGKLCLLEVFHDGTTQNSVIFATADRKQNLGYADISTEWSTDRSHRARTTVVWSSDSARAAVHDTIAKHSTVSIYRRVGDRFERLKTHDILAAACAQWGIPRERVVSSGQCPLRWPAGDIVTIEVSARLQDGKHLRRAFPIHAPLEGKSIQQ